MEEGMMSIGDEWTAIQLIARSQTNPQKAIAELVENSLDARASRVLIERFKYKRKPALYVEDAGDGFPLNSKGIPDVEGTPKRICDSLKRKLDEAERKGIHGEFGIGLLGFWSVGDKLIVLTKASQTDTWQLEMKAGERPYKWGRGEKQDIINGHGTVLIIYPVRKEMQNRLTAEKLAKYLGEELRDRIRKSGAEVIVKDTILKKELRVRPAEFPGEPLREIESLHVEGYPPIKVELYWSLMKEGEVPPVALCKDGTRVIKDILELDEFQCPPWNNRRLIGILDFPAFKLAPTTRAGIVPDEAYKAFVAVVKAREPLLIKLLEEKEKEKEE
ncbi:MAG: ATP-binding protein, partial [Nitrospirae bacterium]|nr:ATP-binding protein [Nitrospirota bacterium]